MQLKIGILNLKNSSGTNEFSRNDIKTVLNDLRHYIPGSQDFPSYVAYQNKEYKRMKENPYFEPIERKIEIKK